MHDLDAIYKQIGIAAGKQVADAYFTRLDDFILGLNIASERGTVRDLIRKGLRVVPFEGRVNVAFIVKAKQVVILRVFRGGQNWQTEF